MLMDKEDPPPPTGEQLRDQAIEDVARGEGAWIAKIIDMIRPLSSGKEFTTDLLWAGAAAAKLTTHEPRVMGAAMRLAKKLGLAVPTKQQEKSTRAKCHARPLTVWRRT